MVGSRTVFVDVNPLAERHLTGIGRYTARLALALARQAGGAVRFVSQRPGSARPARARLVAGPGPRALGTPRLARAARAAPRRWRSRPTASPFTAASASTSRRFPFEVSVLHDFTTHGRAAHPRRADARPVRGFFAETLLASDAAVAVSQSTRADARWLCDFPPEKIVVAPSGPEPLRRATTSTTPRSSGGPNVGLVVSTLEPRKNAFFLLDWFRQTEALPEELGALVGRPDRLADVPAAAPSVSEDEGAAGSGSSGSCPTRRSAGSIARRGGRPTLLYEGFGFPVLDALRHGTPVLASYHSALRELDHPGVHFFDPYDAATVDDAWRRLQAAGLRRSSLGPRSTPSITGTPSPAPCSTCERSEAGSPRARPEPPCICCVLESGFLLGCVGTRRKRAKEKGQRKKRTREKKGTDPLSRLACSPVRSLWF